MDHYASLGVSRTSEDVVIRAAYLALMRRYHPDGNASPEAAERVRAITRAYDVIGDPAKRRDYDRREEFGGGPAPSGGGVLLRRGPVAFMITILCLALLIAIILARTPAATPRDQGIGAPVLPARDLVQPITCLSPEAKDLSRQAIIRQARALRLRNDQLPTLTGDALSVRTSPAISLTTPQRDVVECSAAITLLLPGGAVGADGNSVVQGEADFLLGRTAEGAPTLVDLKTDDRFLLALASVQRAPASVSIDDQAGQADAIAVPAPAPATIEPSRSHKATPKREPHKEEEAARTPLPRAVVVKGGTKPISCTRGAACDRDNVAALEQQLLIFERQSLGHADAARRTALNQTRARFEARRASCGTSACVRDAILARTVQVAEVMRRGAAATP